MLRKLFQKIKCKKPMVKVQIHLEWVTTDRIHRAIRTLHQHETITDPWETTTVDQAVVGIIKVECNACPIRATTITNRLCPCMSNRQTTIQDHLVTTCRCHHQIHISKDTIKWAKIKQHQHLHHLRHHQCLLKHQQLQRDQQWTTICIIKHSRCHTTTILVRVFRRDQATCNHLALHMDKLPVTVIQQAWAAMVQWATHITCQRHQQIRVDRRTVLVHHMVMFHQHQHRTIVLLHTVSQHKIMDLPTMVICHHHNRTAVDPCATHEGKQAMIYSYFRQIFTGFLEK